MSDDAMPTAAMPRGGESLRAELAARGFAVVALDDRAASRFLQPWLLIDRLLGVAPELTEAQPIRPVPHGRSFAASTGPAPLHTDSQQWRGRPPELQLTYCLRPAANDGESVLVDGFALADRLATAAPELLARLVDVPRRMPFVFGPVYGPTLARRGGRHVISHPPRAPADDPIAARLEAELTRAPVEIVRLERGQLLVVDNQRMLHGRRTFDDRDRELLRVLAWLPEALHARPSWADRAELVHAELARRLLGRPLEVRLAFGLDAAPMDPRDAGVWAMLSGAPPGAVARRLGVEEVELYRHRDRLTARGPLDAVVPGGTESDSTAVSDVEGTRDVEAECAAILRALRIEATTRGA